MPALWAKGQKNGSSQRNQQVNYDKIITSIEKQTKTILDGKLGMIMYSAGKDGRKQGFFPLGRSWFRDSNHNCAHICCLTHQWLSEEFIWPIFPQIWVIQHLGSWGRYWLLVIMKGKYLGARINSLIFKDQQLIPFPLELFAVAYLLLNLWHDFFSVFSFPQVVFPISVLSQFSLYPL